VSCSATGQVCQGAACVKRTCDATSCPLGCCDANAVCQDGFLDTQCGSGGGACTDCTASSTTCAVNQTPRLCTPQTTCPASYGGCSAQTQTPVPLQQSGACTAADLAQAQSGCAGGATSAGCQAFLKTLASNGGAKCAACLQPFVVPLQQGTGVFLCAAPFVAATCNHDTGCYTDCLTVSCSQCPAGEAAQCQATATSGACATFTQGLTCLQGALVPPGKGAFCSPTAYSGFAAWLAAVGAYYCE
jgi:hypothetical protein